MCAMSSLKKSKLFFCRSFAIKFRFAVIKRVSAVTINTTSIESSGSTRYLALVELQCTPIVYKMRVIRSSILQPFRSLCRLRRAGSVCVNHFFLLLNQSSYWINC